MPLGLRQSGSAGALFRASSGTGLNNGGGVNAFGSAPSNPRQADGPGQTLPTTTHTPIPAGGPLASQPDPSTLFPTAGRSAPPLPPNPQYDQLLSQIGTDPALSAIRERLAVLNEGSLQDAVGGEADFLEGIFNRDADISRRRADLSSQELQQAQAAAAQGLIGVEDLRRIAGQRLSNSISGINLDREASKRQADDDKFGNKVNATSSGNLFGIGRRRRDNTIQNNLADALKNADLAESSARLSNEEANIGLDNREQSARQTQNNLTLRAESLGLDREQMENALADGLRNLGIDRADALDLLTQESDQLTAQQQAVQEALLMEALNSQQIFNLPPQQANQLATPAASAQQRWYQQPTQTNQPSLRPSPQSARVPRQADTQVSARLGSVLR